jgi:AcrR family transcriptional regulator
MMRNQTRKKKEDRLQEVKAAARRLFKKCGYDKVSTKMIAEEAGISRALIYRYNWSKSEILSHLLIDMLSHQAEVLEGHAKKLKVTESKEYPWVELTVNYFEKLFQLDTDPEIIKFRQLAAQQSWSWGQKIETEIYAKAGNLFWPLYDLFEENGGPKLDEGARNAIWAAYTETLRHWVAQTESLELPNICAWKAAYRVQINLIINGIT